MTDITDLNLGLPKQLHGLATQQKAILDSICVELDLNVEMLINQISTLSPQATLRLNSSIHPDVQKQIAQSALSLMRLCACLNIDFTKAIEEWIVERESELFSQQKLQL